RYVKGMGVFVRGQAQVSMNLTDFEQTPIARVFEFVKREAARHGVMPVSSEIVGLIPKKALEEAAEWFLQVENFDSSLIVENRLAAAHGGIVARMSRGKKAYQQYEPELSDAVARLNRLREELKASIDLDAASYAEVMKAYRDAKTFPPEVGERAVSDALKNATRVPLRIAQKAHEVRQLVESLKPITSKNMWSDL